MHRKSVLLPVECDLKRLSLGGLEAFVLSQVGERSLVEDVAETAGLEVDEMLRLAQRLKDLGALAVEDVGAKGRRPSGSRRAVKATAPPGARRSSASLRAAKAAAAPAAGRSSGSHHAAKNNAPPTAGRRSGSHQAAKTAASPPPRSVIPPAAVPVRQSRADLRTLNIGPREGFVLSQIDGATSVGDLVEITQLSLSDLRDALQRLEAVGVVELPHEKRGSANPTPPAPPEPAPVSVIVNTPEPLAKSRLGALSDAERTLITGMAARVDVTSHYDVLAVERDADAKTIRRAYHALAAQFHPDRFFGKDLGTYKRPLERIFDRITRAYDTLSRKAEREAHDATLGPPPPPPASSKASSTPVRRASRKMKAATKSSAKLEAASTKSSAKLEAASTKSSAKLEAASARALRASQASAARASSPAAPPAPATAAAVAPTPVAAAAPIPVAAAAATPMAAAAPLPVEDASPRMRAARPDALFRLYADKQQKTARDHIGVFLRAAKEALDRDDVVAAAGHFRLAAQCTHDPAVHAALADADGKARVRIRATSLEQARAAESAGRWGEAATKYARAHDLQPEAWVAERAANAMRQDGKELKRAAQLAEQAVLAEPHNAAYRVTLGEIYCDAGLMNRAAGESGRASGLAPGDARVQALASRVAKVKRR